MPADALPLNGTTPLDSAVPVEQAKQAFSTETFTLVCVLFGLALILLVVVIYGRRKKIRRRQQLSHSAWPASASRNNSPPATLSRDSRHRKRRRKRRSEERPRNPTLAETSGLPPKRPDDQPPTGL